MLRQLSKSFLVPIISILFVVLAALVIDQSFNAYIQLVFLYICINIILALSLNLVNGFTGQFSIGHAGFMAVGAYTSAFLSTHPMIFGHPLHFLPQAFDFFNYPIYAILGGLAAALAGYIVGLPSLRLRGDYLAIVTLGFGEIIRVILLNTEAVGGARGMFGISSPVAIKLGGFEISAFAQGFFLAATAMMLTFIILWRIINSSHGRGFLSVREDEIAAEAMGINTTSIKVRAFVLSSFFAGIAGSVFAHSTHYLNPSTFSFQKSVDVIIMVVLGGMGSLTGSIVAAIIVSVLPELVLRPLQDYTHIDLRMVIYSLMLIIFMIMRPKGIFGTSEISFASITRTKLFQKLFNGRSANAVKNS